MNIDILKFFTDQGVLFIFFVLVIWGVNRFTSYIAPLLKIYLNQQSIFQSSILQTLKELSELQKTANTRIDFIQDYLLKELNREK